MPSFGRFVEQFNRAQLAFHFSLPQRDRRRQPKLNVLKLRPPSPSVLAALAVRQHRKDFDGWPTCTTFDYDRDDVRLVRLMPKLNERMHRMRRDLVWSYLTVAVNDARTREREAYRRQVADLMREED